MVAHGGRNIWRRGRAVHSALLVLAGVAACAPPDRPPRLPEPLPEAARSWLAPDSVRVRRVADGVWYHYLWSGKGPWAVHVVQVDLQRCELGLDVVRAPALPGASGGLARVSEMEEVVADPRALVAVNGDFFTPEGHPLGPELDDGGLRTARERPALAWRPGRGPWMGTARLEGDSLLHVGWPVPVQGLGDGAAPVRTGEVVGGFPELLDRGRRVGDLEVSERPSFAASRHPRTAVGYDAGSGRAWIVVVDGRQGGYSLGMTLPELVELLEALGATDALNLDGGGSSILVLRGRPVSRPSDETGERPVVNALVLRHDPAYCAPSRAGRGTDRR